MRLLAAVSPGEVRVAAVDATGLCDVAVWRPGAPDGVGDLHRGRVTAVVPAMAGAFVQLVDAEGFLPDSSTAGRVSVGTLLAVKVTRAAQAGKGPRLTARLDPEAAAAAGSGEVRRLRRGPDAVSRLAALHPAAPVEVDDAGLVADLRPGLGVRLRLVAAAFDDAVETAVSALDAATAELPGGARMSVHPTPALTAIDIDLAAATADRAGKSHAQVKRNRAMLPALARQIRLRNLSGAILIDLAGMSVRKRAALGPDLAASLASDPLKPRLLGFTGLGLAEVVRPRIHPPIHELLAGPHAAGLAALRRLAREVAAAPSRLPTLRAAPAVVAALEGDAVARADLARGAGRPLILRTDRALAPLGWSLDP